MSEQNGEAKQVSAIIITFDPATQAIEFQFDRNVFKTWDYLKAILHMAIDHAEDIKKEARMMALQKMVEESRKMENLRNKIGM